MTNPEEEPVLGQPVPEPPPSDAAAEEFLSNPNPEGGAPLAAPVATEVSSPPAEEPPPEVENVPPAPRMDIEYQFRELIQATLNDLGGGITASKDDLARYGAQRAVLLAGILERSEPGFDQAVIAERNNMALRAGLHAGSAANQVDGIWMGIFAGALRMAAIALV